MVHLIQHAHLAFALSHPSCFKKASFSGALEDWADSTFIVIDWTWLFATYSYGSNMYLYTLLLTIWNVYIQVSDRKLEEI